MEIIDGVEIRDLSLYLKKEKILVVTDFHIGYEEDLNKRGVFIPRFQFKDILDRLERILDGIAVKKVVILGDLKHEFGVISLTEWKNTLQLIDFLTARCKSIILLKGNHDKILGPITAKRSIKVRKSFKAGRFLFAHGDYVPKNITQDVIIIGHEHPAVSLKKDGRSEVYKCFLKGKWKDKTLLVLPSFNLVAEGTDVLRDDMLSPFLNDISKFRVYIVSGGVYDFGKLSDLKKL